MDARSHKAPASPNVLAHGLARSEAAERLDALLRTADEAFYEVRLSEGTISWSPGIQLLLGHDPLRVGDRLEPWQSLVHPDDLAALIESGHQALARGGSSWSGEFRMARDDGSYAPVRVRAYVLREADRPAWVVGALSDLSAVRTLEEELEAATAELGDEVERERRERARAELLMRSSMSEALGEWDLETNAMLWSPNVQEVLGYPASEMATMDDVLQHSVRGDAERAAAEARLRVVAGGPGWAGRFSWTLPSGEQVTAEVNSYVMRDPSGRPERLIGSVRTVPERVELPAASPPAAALTDRQREVLRLIRLGRTNKEIAELFGISEQGAKTLVSRLLRKFGVSNRAALAAMPPTEEPPSG